MTEPKNIIFCADGSWSHPDKVQDGTHSHPNKKPGSLSGNTNVYKLYDALIPSANQVAFYDSGVGTKGGRIDHFAGGLLGEGLFDKIKDGYDDIAKVYRDGDAIHLFGFSRGALTVNSLAEMISICGLPEPGKYSKEALDIAFAAYRERDPIKRQGLLKILKKEYGNDPIGHPVKIAQLGVWDMVGSMGIPGTLSGKIDEKHYGFMSPHLAPNVEHAWHALAIDERRKQFQPFLWETPSGPEQKVDQVYFSGMHSDVGGGTRDSRLSDITLGWMMKKAASLGGPLALQFDPERLQKLTHLPVSNALGSMKESWNGLWGLYKRRDIPSDAVVADSVLQRIERDPRYHPSKLVPEAGSWSIASILPATMTVEPVLEPSPARGRA